MSTEKIQASHRERVAIELGPLRQRAREALLQMIRRGVVLGEVPVGYVRTESRQIELIPDRQVQQAVHGVFAKFREMGSARQVFLWPMPSTYPVFPWPPRLPIPRVCLSK